MLRRPAPVPRLVDPRLPRWWEGTIAVLTVLSIVLVVVELALEVTDRNDARRHVLRTVDVGFCGIFLLDYAIRLWRSESRLEFVRRTWVELVGSVPAVGPLRAVRGVRLARLVRLWRAGHVLRRRYDVTVPAEVTNLGVAVVLVWVGTAFAMYAVEHRENEHIRGFDDALWWSMTTLSTVGYGDVYPETRAGRLVATVTMVLGVGVLGTLAATLATTLIDLRERGRRGLRSWRMNEHLLVLGWNAKSPAAVRDFRLDPRYREMPIAIVAELEASPVDDPEVRFVKGVPSRREVLERASAAQATAAMVFARDPTDPRSDHQTALTVLALRRLNKDVKIGAELVDSANREDLAEVGCDAIIDFGGLGAMMLVRGIQDLGVTEVVEDLLSNESGSELYRVRPEEEWVGKTYRELAVALVDEDVALIGLERGDKRMLNPDGATVLEATDHLFVVAREPP